MVTFRADAFEHLPVKPVPVLLQVNGRPLEGGVQYGRRRECTLNMTVVLSGKVRLFPN